MKQFVLFLSVFLPIIGFSQINQYGIPFITNYSPQQYDAAEQNWAVVQDNRGVIFIGNNDNGVLEYDGVQWRKIPVSNNSIVRSLAVDQSGTVYVGAVDEFGFLNVNEQGKLFYQSLINILDSSNLNFSDVWKTYTHYDDKYFCTYEKIFQVNKNNEIKIIELGEEFKFSFLIDGEIYVENFLKGLGKLNNGKFELLPGGAFFANRDVFFIEKIEQKKLLVGTIFYGVFILNLEDGQITKQETFDTVNEQFKKTLIYGGTRISENLFGLGTLYGGFYAIDLNGNMVNIINVENGIYDKTITYPYVKHQNNSVLWLGLNKGISKVEINSPIAEFTENQGLDGALNDVIQFQNSLYVASDLGVYKMTTDNNKQTIFENINFKDQTWSFLNFKTSLDKERLVIGTSVGIFDITNDKIQQLQFKGRDNSNYYTYKLYQDEYDYSVFYAGHSKGIIKVKFENNVWIILDDYNEIKEEIRDIFIDNDNDIWLGTNFDGVVRVIENKEVKEIKHYNKNCGLKSLKEIIIFSLNDKLAFGTQNGIYSFDKSKEYFYPDTILGVEFCNGSKGIFRFVDDHNGSYWFSLLNSEKHWIERVIKDKNDYAFQKKPFMRLPSEKIFSIYTDNKNITWLASSSGLYSFNNNLKKSYNTEYHTLIRKITTIDDSVIFFGTNYKEVTNNDHLVAIDQPDNLKIQLSYNYNALTFEFAAPFFEEEKQTKYSYKLDGYKDTWSKWSLEPKAVFTNLNEGNYNFLVKAKNIYDVESEIASFEFSISPPWYRTILAYIIYGIVAIVIVYVIVKLYTRKLELEKIRLEGIVAERTAEIRKKNEELEYKNEEITNQRDQIAKQKEHITDSIKYAQKIQQAVVPSDERKNELLRDHFLLWRPRDIVSGDFWWMTEKDNKVILAAADCTGHGVPGAFMSMLGVSFLNEIVNKLQDVHPHLILNQLRANVKTTLKQTGKEGEAKDGMDIALVIIDYDNMILEYAGAYNPLYLIRNGELIETKADKNPIGIYIKEKDSFTLHTFDLQSGDTIYIFSDGFVDQFGGEKKDKYKSKRFKEFLINIQDKSMPEQGEILDKELTEWRGEIEQIDDVIIIGVRF